MARSRKRRTAGRPPAAERAALDTRAELLDAAAEVFAERGFGSATVDEIVARAELSKGTFYWHFAGKEDVFTALVEARIDAPARAVMEITRVAPAEGASAASVSEGLAAIFEQEHQLILLLHEYWAMAARDHELQARYRERQSGLRETLARALAARHERTGVPLAVPATALATAFMALAEGLSREALIDPESLPEGLFGEIVSLVYDGMAARGEAAGTPR